MVYKSGNEGQESPIVCVFKKSEGNCTITFFYLKQMVFIKNVEKKI
ncbi:unnamed protein product [marine sediment metagenome]|uniref:Uncharacterized protein n=1 Tax=marine sediment metagenome TaxID=412755 RepID=X1JTG8_9ZZZZ